MADVEVKATTTTASVTVNNSYFSSWQAVLKIFKMICFFACLVCSSLILSRYGRYHYSYWTQEIQYCVALSVIGFVSEAVILVLYCIGLNNKCADRPVLCYTLMIIYHCIMAVLVYAACILMTSGASVMHVDAARAFNAFGILALAGFALEIYFNIVWLRGGPELVAMCG